MKDIEETKKIKENGVLIVFAAFLMLSACVPLQRQDSPAYPIIETDSMPKQNNDPAADFPVVVSYVKDQWTSAAEIVTIGINYASNYAVIPVKKETVLKALPAVDQNHNVYLTYGTNYGVNSTIFAILGPDGSLETINLPVNGPVYNNALWVGNRLVINKGKLVLVDVDLQVEELPAINTLPDGSSAIGFLGVSNAAENLLVWVASQPLIEEERLFAFYRTLDIDNNEISEKKIEIPYSTQDYRLPVPSEVRLGTIVLGVDTTSDNVLLCFGKKPEEENMVYSHFELYSTDIQQSLSSEQICCLNAIVQTNSETYSSNFPVETCGFEIARRYSDGSDLIDFSAEPPLRVGDWRWHGTNGKYWIMINQKTLTILNDAGEKLQEIDMPDVNLADCFAPDCISPAFLIMLE